MGAKETYCAELTSELARAIHPGACRRTRSDWTSCVLRLPLFLSVFLGDILVQRVPRPPSSPPRRSAVVGRAAAFEGPRCRHTIGLEGVGLGPELLEEVGVHR